MKQSPFFKSTTDREAGGCSLSSLGRKGYKVQASLHTRNFSLDQGRNAHGHIKIFLLARLGSPFLESCRNLGLFHYLLYIKQAYISRITSVEGENEETGWALVLPHLVTWSLSGPYHGPSASWNFSFWELAASLKLCSVGMGVLVSIFLFLAHFHRCLPYLVSNFPVFFDHLP